MAEEECTHDCTTMLAARRQIARQFSLMLRNECCTGNWLTKSKRRMRMMKKSNRMALCANAALVFWMISMTCYVGNGAVDPGPRLGAERKASVGNRPSWRQGDFAGKLYRQMAKDNENLAFSPYGVASVCALVGTGAKGETFEAFKNALEFPTDNLDEMARIFRETKQKIGNAVEISDSVWLFKGFSPLDEFRSRAVNGFLAEARNTSLESAKDEINAYVSDKTHGKIPSLLVNPPDSNTCMMAVNTIYLNAKWAQKFDKNLTTEREFKTLSGERLRVPFMCRTLHTNYHCENQFSAVSLPYANSTLEMLFILPGENVALRQIEEMLSESFINRVIGMYKEEVRVIIPRFEFEMRHNLVTPLREMGLGVAFSLAADFSGLAKVNPDECIYISNAEQMVKIKVDEEGTEAAAATYIEMQAMKKSLPPPVPKFVADHPFIFVLRDRASGAILFMGRVMKPAAQK